MAIKLKDVTISRNIYYVREKCRSIDLRKIFILRTQEIKFT